MKLALLLSDNEDDIYHVISLISEVANLDDRIYPNGFMKGPADNRQVIDYPLTRRAWIDGIILNGNDLLTYDAGNKNRQHLSRSSGSKGDGVDDSGPIVEFGRMRGNKKPARLMFNAIRVFVYFEKN